MSRNEAIDEIGKAVKLLKEIERLAKNGKGTSCEIGSEKDMIEDRARKAGKLLAHAIEMLG